MAFLDPDDLSLGHEIQDSVFPGDDIPGVLYRVTELIEVEGLWLVSSPNVYHRESMIIGRGHKNQILKGNDPAWIGVVMSIILLTQVYALLLAFCVVHPLVGSLRQRLDEMGI